MSSGTPMSEETHHKMSKKIAQLTKVIFHLHSKNEENQGFSTALTNAYEKEIETILTSANGIVSKQKDALDKAKSMNNYADQIKQQQETHEREKRESQEAFESFRVSVKDKENNLSQEYQGKVNEFKMEVAEMRAKFDRRIEEFKKQMEDFKKNNSAMDELKKAHQKELAAYIQEHNKKYSELLHEKLSSEEALKAKAEADKQALIKEWEKKLKEAVEKARAEEREKAKKDLDAQQNTYDNQISALEPKNKRLESDINGLNK